MNSQGPQQHSITEAAAEWAVRLHAGALTDQEQAELQHWIACDSRHEAALRFAEQTWAALGDVYKEEPVHRQRPSAAALPARRSKRRRPWQRVAAIALVVVVAGVGWVRGPDVLLRMQADYMTEKGEVRTVHLADGSKVELDSGSAIRLDYDGVQRRISLLQGSAIFDVAPMVGEETRPFVVQSAGGRPGRWARGLWWNAKAIARRGSAYSNTVSRFPCRPSRKRARPTGCSRTAWPRATTSRKASCPWNSSM